MKKVLLLLCLWVNQPIYAQLLLDSDIVSDSVSYVAESFTFLDMEGKQLLKGTLTIPKGFSSLTKVVVFVSPPLPVSRDYHGLFSTLADVFSSNGIATLRFDNRAYTDKSLLPKEETVTMFDQADDVHQAVQTLRKDKRFAYNCIGLLGHSEGGAAVSIEASRNENIAFAVCLSTCGVLGVDFAYTQTAMPIEFNEKIPNDIKQDLLSSLKIYLHIVKEKNSVDSIKEYLKQEVERRYRTVKDRNKVFGRKSLEEITQTTIWGYTRPRVIAFIKYNPALYYSKLSCPVLVACGKMDGNLDCQSNLKGIEDILRKSGNKSYEIMAIDSVDHEYMKVNQTIPFFIAKMFSYKSHSKPEYAREVFEYIARWVNKVSK